jgi:NAD(P)-dependent dehydrogenase (short-subunit alcohol dehydrogenase family)
VGRLTGKVAIVTGAGSAGLEWGIGKAVATLFAREGASVVALDRSEDAAFETAKIIQNEGGICEAVVADVTRQADVKDVVEACINQFGKIDILHNNVGILAPGGPEEVKDEDWDRVFAVNVTSLLYTCRAVLPHMAARRSGSIINVSSIASQRHLGIDYIAYPSSKAAVNQFSRALAVQYGPAGIRCNTILPGFIRTPMVKQQVLRALGAEADDGALKRYYDRREASIPLRRMGEAWDIAYAALYLASDESSYVTGLELVVDGGVTQRVP